MLPLDRHVLAAVLTALLVLAAAPLVAWGDGAGSRTGTATSATARAAAVDRMSAPDRRWPVAGAAVEAAVRIADRHWGGSPCRGEVAMEWTTLAAGTNATASWRNPTHAWKNPAENFDCRIELSRAAGYDWAKLCTVVVHELGHLHGRPHDDADHVMAAVYRRPLAACAAVADPAAPAAATQTAAAARRRTGARRARARAAVRERQRQGTRRPVRARARAQRA